ncbi:MAG: hypothetical protein QOG13_1349 [Sphingomonadales bacterium]|jgi:hypothetical protein|nr:hypothetical protein [Sphingomonadales bacterium]MEA3043416.1 hypothetical protein [Sphingomonadales bacterium]
MKAPDPKRQRMLEKLLGAQMRGGLLGSGFRSSPSPPKPFRRRRGKDGGEAIPAEPTPRPLPLAGGAEAPLDEA